MKFILGSTVLVLLLLQNAYAGYSGSSWVGHDHSSAVEKNLYVSRGGKVVVRMDYKRGGSGGVVDPYLHLFFVNTNFKLTWKATGCKLVKAHHLMCDGLRLKPGQRHTFYAVFQAINGNTNSSFKYNISGNPNLNSFTSQASSVVVKVQ